MDQKKKHYLEHKPLELQILEHFRTKRTEGTLEIRDGQTKHNIDPEA